MSTLLLRLVAPIQAWGSGSKFDIRMTGREPTKSGVLGMLAAALGIRRDDTTALSALTSLRFGVRVDREGAYLHDFHTAHSEKSSYVTHRYYLCDAVFLCGLESDDTESLKKYVFALTHPVFPLFLGRRSCPPTLPLVLGIRDAALNAALSAEPRLVPSDGPLRIRMDADTEDAGAAVFKDVPVSFNPFQREFGYRKCREMILPGTRNAEHGTEHDPFSELEGEDVSDTNGA